MELVIFAFGAVVGLVIGYVLSQKKFQSTQDHLEKAMEQRFENLAHRILDDNSQKFSDQSFKHLNHLIEPFKERLKDFEKKVEESYSTERAERGSLRGELTRLMELNSKMSQEAESLSRALKGDNKTMGNWGEMILENILERSGLRKNEEYIVQGTELALKNDEGQSIRPDVLVKLPDGKHLIIDSKVSLTAYEAYVNAETDSEQEAAAKAHIESLKRHIDGLSAKKYHTAQGLASPDFVMLFMPIEPAFALAFKLKPDLLQTAWDKNIALVSPTTLLSTLRTVAATWKHERQERNALEIAKQGGALYDKFVGFVEDLTELGKKLEQTQKAHSQVMNKLSEGSGNLIRRVENLKELGVKTDKKLMLDQ
ncbi:MAG: DNA recombination protein RmuC [Pseudobdellovibrionaceae bacterium]